jgi:glutathione-regulated potassium-efflux system ancillary protein KefG
MTTILPDTGSMESTAVSEAVGESTAGRPARGLIVFAHPALERARVAPAMLHAAERLSQFPVRDLYDLYPDMTIDVLAEQIAMAVSDFVVLQFPLYWYSVPALLKEWLDLVWVPGWAYGKGGTVLKGKTLACAFSAGGGGHAYGPDGANRFSIDELMRPWEQTAFLCGMRWIPPFVIHDAGEIDDVTLAAEASRYARWLRAEATQSVKVNS